MYFLNENTYWVCSSFRTCLEPGSFRTHYVDQAGLPSAEMKSVYPHGYSKLNSTKLCHCELNGLPKILVMKSYSPKYPCSQGFKK